MQSPCVDTNVTGTSLGSGQIPTKEVTLLVKKTILALLLALSLAPAVAVAQMGVVIRVAPPAPIVEYHERPPHPGFVWVDGYHRWNGRRYVWVRGHWMRPPHPGAVWIAHHYEQRDGGWVLIEGHWR